MSDQLLFDSEIPRTNDFGSESATTNTARPTAQATGPTLNTFNSTMPMPPQNNNNFLTGNSNSSHRPNYILGGVDRQIDETSAKLRENFLAFLERYREASSSNSSTDPSRLTVSSSTLGTSEMLLSTTQGSEAALFSDTNNNPLYRQQLSEIRNEGFNTIYVDFNHLYRFDDVLANAIAENFYRYLYNGIY